MGNSYTASNNTATHTLTNVAGCDSGTDLTILNSTTGVDVQEHCTSILDIASNNTATHTLTNGVVTVYNFRLNN